MKDMLIFIDLTGFAAPCVLLEARYILGNNALFEDMRKRFEQEIVRTTAREFVATKLAEREARVRRAGNSRYLVDPNVKEGKGGLRDLNTLFWIGKYVYRVREARDQSLSQFGVSASAIAFPSRSSR